MRNWINAAKFLTEAGIVNANTKLVLKYPKNVEVSGGFGVEGDRICVAQSEEP